LFVRICPKKDVFKFLHLFDNRIFGSLCNQKGIKRDVAKAGSKLKVSTKFFANDRQKASLELLEKDS
jgi:hypothetical protein